MVAVNTNMKKEQLEKALDFDPFEGDFGESSDCTLKDKIVKVRKPHICHICDGAINAEELARNITQVFEGQIGTWYFCHECCKAMAKVFDYENNDDDEDEDSDEEINKRYSLGFDRRNNRCR